jgi:hypothetical protein
MQHPVRAVLFWSGSIHAALTAETPVPQRSVKAVRVKIGIVKENGHYPSPPNRPASGMCVLLALYSDKLYVEMDTDDQSENGLRRVCIRIIAEPQLAKTIREFVLSFKQKDSTLIFWYMAKDGPESAHLRLQSFGEYKPEYYPWLPKDYWQHYLQSSASILFLMGPPGTGKTSVLRHMLTSNNLSVRITYDEEVLQHEKMFMRFVQGTYGNDVLIVEEADNILQSRYREK